jgi:hypothetical protein
VVEVQISRSGADKPGAGRRVVARRAAAGVAVSILAGCTTSVAGVAVPAVEGMSASAVGASATSLDTGAYQTFPGPPAGKAGSESYGRLLEGHRMATYVVLPSDVDPALTIAIPQNTFTATTPDGLPEPLDADDAKDFVVGFSTARSSSGHDVLINMVLRFANPDTAADAAGDIAADYAHAAGGVAIPGHSGTQAFASKTDGGTELRAVTAHREYVLFQYVQSHDGDRATALAAKTLDLQEPLIDRFAPSNIAQFVDLPADTTGLLSRTLREDPRYSPFPGAWVLTPQAAMHFQENTATAGAAFADAGIRAVSIGKATVYEAADPHGAQRLATSLIAAGLDRGYRPAAPVPGLPAARCLDGVSDSDHVDDSPRQFYCVASADGYAFEVYSAQEGDAHQETAAQYLMLVAPGSA